MTEKKYPHYRYIPHRVILRLIVLSPIAIAHYVSSIITQKLEKVNTKLDKSLPIAYTQEWVTFDKLPKRKQQEIEQLAKHRDTVKERILFQTQKVQ